MAHTKCHWNARIVLTGGGERTWKTQEDGHTGEMWYVKLEDPSRAYDPWKGHRSALARGAEKSRKTSMVALFCEPGWMVGKEFTEQLGPWINKGQVAILKAACRKPYDTIIIMHCRVEVTTKGTWLIENYGDAIKHPRGKIRVQPTWVPLSLNHQKEAKMDDPEAESSYLP